MPGSAFHVPFVLSSNIAAAAVPGCDQVCAIECVAGGRRALWAQGQLLEGSNGGQVEGSFIQGSLVDMERECVGPIVEFEGLRELFDQLVGLYVQSLPPVKGFVYEDLQD